VDEDTIVESCGSSCSVNAFEAEEVEEVLDVGLAVVEYMLSSTEDKLGYGVALNDMDKLGELVGEG